MNDRDPKQDPQPEDKLKGSQPLWGRHKTITVVRRNANVILVETRVGGAIRRKTFNLEEWQAWTKNATIIRYGR